MAVLKSILSERTVKKIAGQIAEGKLTPQSKDRLSKDRDLRGAVMETLLAEKVQKTTTEACAEFMGMGLLTDGMLFAKVSIEHEDGKKGTKMGFQIADDEEPRTPSGKKVKMGF